MKIRKIGRGSCRERVKISVKRGARKRRHTRSKRDWSSDVCSSDLYLNGEIETPSISAEGKNVIVIGAGDTGADCVATALRENCKSIVQFNKYTKQPEAIEFDENT